MLAIALGWATYRLIETPLRRVKSSFKPVALTAIMATLGCVGFMTYQENGLAWRQNIKESQLISEQFVSTTGWKYTKNELCLTRYKFEESKKYPWWFCITNKDQNPTVVLLGNSYANHLYPGIVHAYPNESVLSIGACDPAYVGGPANTGDPCALDWPKHQAEFIDSIIKNSRSVKVVIIDGLISFKPKEYTDQQYAENLKQRISYMQDLGIKIVIFAPHIKTNYDIKGCFSRPLKSPEKDCIITAVERKKLFNEFTPLMREIGESFDNVLFFDQNDTFCSNNGCSMIIDGMPAFRDEYYHFTEYASDAVGKNFSVWAKGNGLNLK
ncbi:hypothetical protein Pres01_42430 [Metapseudomonas resinovorans]|nr:hypothetical protein Pres01_42430 [Pseudomonas resinovorans]